MSSCPLNDEKRGGVWGGADKCYEGGNQNRSQDPGFGILQVVCIM